MFKMFQFLVLVVYLCIYNIFLFNIFTSASVSRYFLNIRLKHLFIHSAERKTLINTRKYEDPTGASTIKSKQLRDILFWSKVLQIYQSYKIFQIKKFIEYKTLLSSSLDQNKLQDEWDLIHELNSQRMLDLCLSLRGFYLKTGQMLGTRYDFMPIQYILKLSKLHDDVPPLNEETIKSILEKELNGNLNDYFNEIDLKSPIGSASIGQVHKGIWKLTKEVVAVKIQYPNAKKLMVNDLANLRILAEFLQKTELKFDILSAIKELQKQIINEFDFNRESANMEYFRKHLLKVFPSTVKIPKSIYHKDSILVMSYLEGQNLGKSNEYKDHNKSNYNSIISVISKQQAGIKLLNVLAHVWGEQIFNLKRFHADPHPGNICISKKHGLCLLDWGQVKYLSDDLHYKFSVFIEALNSRKQDLIVPAFLNLGVKVSNPTDLNSIEAIAVTMLDTRSIEGFSSDPFQANNALRSNAVTYLPSELYFIVRTIQLFRGMSYAFKLKDYSIASKWSTYARKVIKDST